MSIEEMSVSLAAMSQSSTRVLSATNFPD